MRKVRNGKAERTKYNVMESWEWTARAHKHVSVVGTIGRRTTSVSTAVCKRAELRGIEGPKFVIEDMVATNSYSCQSNGDLFATHSLWQTYSQLSSMDHLQAASCSSLSTFYLPSLCWFLLQSGSVIRIQIYLIADTRHMELRKVLKMKERYVHIVRTGKWNWREIWKPGIKYGYI